MKPAQAPMPQHGAREVAASSLNAWCGATILQSGSTSITVSTAMVSTGSLILMATEPRSIGAGHNSGGNIVVASRVAGISFAFARATGTAVPWDENVMWEIVRRVGPSGKAI